MLMRTKKSPKAVDIHVGARVRLARQLAGMSQEALAGASEITFQQVQKYEKGTNRISASRLVEFSGILNVPVAWFFEGAPGVGTGEAPDFPTLSATELALIKSMRDLSPDAARAVVNLARTMTGNA